MNTKNSNTFEKFTNAFICKYADLAPKYIDYFEKYLFGGWPCSKVGGCRELWLHFGWFGIYLNFGRHFLRRLYMEVLWRKISLENLNSKAMKMKIAIYFSKE